MSQIMLSKLYNNCQIAIQMYTDNPESNPFQTDSYYFNGIH